MIFAYVDGAKIPKNLMGGFRKDFEMRAFKMGQEVMLSSPLPGF